MPTRRRWVVQGTTGLPEPPGEPMALQEALHAAQHLADTSGADVTVRLEPSDRSDLPTDSREPADSPERDENTGPDVVSEDLVVRPQAPRADASRPVPQPPPPTVDRLGAWTVTIAVVLGAELADDDDTAVDQAVSALFSNGPTADLQAAITRPDRTHRRVALRPLDDNRPPRADAAGGGEEGTHPDA